MEKENEFEFEDVENYHGTDKDKLSFKFIVLTQLFNCVKEGSKEMHGSKKNVFDRTGTLMKIPSINQREIYINSVNKLWILLVPVYYKNKESIQSQIEYIESEKTELEKRYKEKFLQIQKAYLNNKKLYNSEVEDLNEQREIKMVEINNSLLLAISHLLNTIDYFQEASFTA